MTFSIVIPAYNGEKFIEKAILSALNQNRRANEIIVHDDNSNDNTRSICEKFYPEVRYYSNPSGPSGFVNGWNKAIALAYSDYISILHQDDLLFPDFLEVAETELKKHPEIRHLFSLCDYIDSDDKTLVKGEQVIKTNKLSDRTKIYDGLDYVKAYQKTYNGTLHIHRCPGVITHRSIFENGCCYNPEAGHIADDDFFYRVGQFTTVLGIIQSLAAFRHHNDSETGKIGDIKLVQRLAHDYLFQIKQWRNSDFMDSKAKYYFEFQAIKFTTRLCAYAYKSGDEQLNNYTLELSKKLRELKFIRQHYFQMTKLLLIQILKRI